MKYLLVIGLFINSSIGFGKAMTFELKDGTFKLNMKKDWVPFFEMYGMPFSVLGPKQGSWRPALMITPTTWKNVTFKPGDVYVNYGKYKQGREAFIRSMKGEVKKFFPYKVSKWDSVNISHHFGFSYEVNDAQFEEHSFYIECKTGQLYHAKILTRGERRSPAAEDGIKILKTFKCIK
jgi:hypothetical protein